MQISDLEIEYSDGVVHGGHCYDAAVEAELDDGRI